jgi:two-component system NtrC family sensor kinase
MQRPVRILLVEDRDDDAQLLIHALRSAGHEVSAERVDTEEAMARALDHAEWDAIIADFSLPSFSGPEALALYRARLLDVPFIMVSGSIDEAQAVASLRSGAHDFVAKANLARLGPALVRELRETEDRRARRRAEEQRHTAEERLHRLIEHMPALSYLCSPTGETLFVGPQILEMTGFSAEEWLADASLWPRLIHPLDRPRVLAERAATSVDHAFAAEYRMLRRDGSVAWWRDEARLVWGPSSRLLLYGFVQDVTERKRAEVELRSQREALHLAEKLAAMGELMAGVAHELNNPLAVVLGQAFLLRRETAGGQGAERVAKIAKAAERCARVVKNFLAIARQEPPSRSNVDLNHVIGETVELLAHSLRMDGIELELALASELPTLAADAHQIQQVLLNLLTNSHHALREALPPRRIRVETGHDVASAKIILTVSDNGPGIPAETRARIFDPFFTTKAPGKGTGLGLSLCRGIVEGHDGTIEAESGLGRGARFRIVLPLASTSGEGPASTPLAAAAPARAKRVLVVDDEPEVAELFAELLSEEGHEVDVAANGKAALARIETARYDVVLCDMRMPELDGPGLHRELSQRFPEMVARLAFVTGDSLSEESRGFLERSGVPYLTKPISLEDLVRVVETVSGDPSDAASSRPPRGESPPRAPAG